MELIMRVKARLAGDQKTKHVHEASVIGFVLDALGEEGRSVLSAGDEMPLPGLGIVKVKSRAARKGRNPKTGESVAIPAKRTVKLEPGKALREALN
nr:HU family DNA-binding protein [Desulfolutivibrio sulfodismutans]